MSEGTWSAWPSAIPVVLPMHPTMTRKRVGNVLGWLGFAGFGLLHIVAFQDDRLWVAAFLDRGAAIAACITVMGIGTALSLPHEQRAAGLALLAGTLLTDAVIVGVELGGIGMWVVPAAVLVSGVASVAALLGGETKREKLWLRIEVGVGLSVVLVLAVLVLLTVDEPFF